LYNSAEYNEIKTPFNAQKYLFKKNTFFLLKAGAGYEMTGNNVFQKKKKKEIKKISRGPTP
jgi:hypothetical protein